MKLIVSDKELGELYNAMVILCNHIVDYTIKDLNNMELDNAEDGVRRLKDCIVLRNYLGSLSSHLHIYKKFDEAIKNVRVKKKLRRKK